MTHGDQASTLQPRRGQRGRVQRLGLLPGENIPTCAGVEDPYEQDVASLNSYSSWTVRYTASELTSLLQKWGGVNASVESLTLTYSDLGNVIQVKLCYANGQSNTITPPHQAPGGIRALFGQLYAEAQEKDYSERAMQHGFA